MRDVKQEEIISGKIREDYGSMLKKKRTIVDIGYDETDFTDEYWTQGGDFGVHFTPRIERTNDNIIKYFDDLIANFNMNKNNIKILDVGAGAGNMVNHFNNFGFNAYGCEYSASGRRLAKERFDVDLEICDLRNSLPYEDNSFDFGMCIGVLSMIPKDSMQNAISEIMRVIRYAVLVSIGTFENPNACEKDKNFMNPHHLTNLPAMEYYHIFNKAGAVDITSIQPPQKKFYGIGTATEFCGIFANKNTMELEI